jgi:hypothetical protein
MPVKKPSANASRNFILGQKKFFLRKSHSFIFIRRVKDIVSYFKDYFKSHFSISSLVTAIVVCTFFTVWEYGYDFTEKHFDPYDNSITGILRYFLLYSFVVMLPLIAHKKFRGKWAQNPNIWVSFSSFFILLLLIYSLRSSWFDWREWLRSMSLELTYYKSAIQLMQASLLLIPSFIIWSFINKNYSLNLQGFKKSKLLPYFILLIAMIPLLLWAASDSDFLETYPQAKRILVGGEKITTNFSDFLIFELSYGLDFLATEYFFRGAMIIGLCRIIGPEIILPVSCFYLTIHFGKPLGETISSFFGGFILGVIAYRTESIWGGVVIHLGIAWMMEVAGGLGNDLF